MLFSRFSKDFSPNPSIVMISSRYFSISKMSPKLCIKPFAINFSRVASDRPSIFMASLLTNSVNALIFFAAQSGFIQKSASTSFSFITLASCPQVGQIFGISRLLLRVRFSAICGMIIFALYTWRVSPIPSCNSFTILTLCTLARLTVVPSSSTGSNTAIGLMRPVLEGLHSISRSVVSLISSAHLNANAFRGNLAVLPSDSP